MPLKLAKTVRQRAIRLVQRRRLPAALPDTELATRLFSRRTCHSDCWLRCSPPRRWQMKSCPGIALQFPLALTDKVKKSSFNVNVPAWTWRISSAKLRWNRVEACWHDRLESAPFRSQPDSNLTSVRAFWRYGRGGAFGCSFWKLRKCRSASAALPRLR